MAFEVMKFFVFLVFLAASRVLAVTLPSSYDVVWTSQSTNSAGSMPVGGGDIGLNAWAENGTILFYIQKSGTFDENNSFLKMGRVRLAFNPNPFSNGTFEQRLLLNDGYVRFTGNDNTTVNLWVDVFNPVIHVEINSALNVKVTASYENWRTEAYMFRSGEKAQSSWGVGSSSKIPDVYNYPDAISYDQGGILMSHRVEELPLWDWQTTQQNLTAVKDTLYNPMKNNEFGLLMTSPDLKSTGNTTDGYYVNSAFKAWNLVSKSPKRSQTITISLYQNQTDSHDDWLSGLSSVISNGAKSKHVDSINWWHQYWDRSYIIINEDASSSDAGFKVGKNYQIYRYMMGCNAFGEWPTKFNGGMFTFDPVFTNAAMPFTPDYRRWGGGTFTAQNQRLLYWPMLRSGDFDAMKGQFDFYKRITPTAQFKAKHFWDLDAAHFTEQIDNTGLSNIYEYDGDGFRYNLARPAEFNTGEDFNRWLVALHDTANEFADMILQANLYSGFDVTPYLSFIESQLAWFDLYYRKVQRGFDPLLLTGTSGNQKLMIYPASGAETYKDAYNPSSTVSGLRKLITDLLAVGKFSLQSSSYYTTYLSQIPETPLRFQQGYLCISPAVAYSRIQNSEPTQLYPVFPWGEYGLGLPNLTYALNTYYYDTETQAFHQQNYGWKQTVIWLARMGVTDLAANLTEARFADSTNFRFPTFKGPNFDWAPDMNHYGAASIALQEQLMQTVSGSTIRLLGAWPTRWNARFKLWAPGNTTVEATVNAGSVKDLVVSPASRAADVVVGSA